MMRSLYSGVSGLRSSQTKIDVIGNNISNVNTVAYKSSSVTFSDVYYQTTRSSSGPDANTGKGGINAMQIGIGTTVASISTAMESEGAVQRTDNLWDLKLSGKGFFVVNDGTQNLFTRAGNFTVDEAGNLVTSNGASVMGWQVDEQGNVVKDQVSALSVKSPKFTYVEPKATTQVGISGNINTTDPSFTSEAGQITTSLSFCDSLGNKYLATVNIKRTDATNYTVSIGKIIDTNSNLETNLTATIDKADLKFNADTGLILNDSSNFKLSFATATLTADQLASGKYKEIPTKIDDMEVDTSKLTIYGDATDLKQSANNGYTVGKMTSVGVDATGKIIAGYSNGKTQTIGQIATANFANPSGLEKVGNNLYKATLNSGEFNGIGDDISALGSSINTMQLEMSNVDLSSEFTEMITAQRGFQANSRIITVSDTMLEELINLKR